MHSVDLLRRTLLLSAPLAAGIASARPTQTARVVILEGFVAWSEDRLSRYGADVAAGVPGLLVEVARRPWSADHHAAFAAAATARGDVDVLVAEYFDAGAAVSRVARARGIVMHVHAAQPDPRVPELRAAAVAPVCFVSSRLAVEVKLVELLLDAVPSLRRLGYVFDPRVQSVPASVHALVRLRGLRLVEVTVQDDDPLASTLSRLKSARVDGAVVLVTSALWPRRAELMQSLIQSRIPAVFERAAAVRDGALIGYGPDGKRQFEQSARYVARILRGEDANRLPEIGPDRLLLEVNLRTAQALGVRLPNDLLRRATAIVR